MLHQYIWQTVFYLFTVAYLLFVGFTSSNDQPIIKSLVLIAGFMCLIPLIGFNSSNYSLPISDMVWVPGVSMVLSLLFLFLGDDDSGPNTKFLFIFVSILNILSTIAFYNTIK